jgi:hypothetical protein
MKRINEIVVALAVMALACGAGAVVKVYVQENDISWIKSTLIRIECKLDGKQFCN